MLSPLFLGMSAAEWSELSGKKSQETLTDQRFCVNKITVVFISQQLTPIIDCCFRIGC
jgi:hypothetical protein